MEANPEGERRAHPRAPVAMAVEVRTAAGRARGDCVNVSGGGLLVALDRWLPVAARVDVALRAPGEDRPMHALGEIVRHLDPGGERRRRLVAIRFLAVDAAEAQRIAEVVERHAERAGARYERARAAFRDAVLSGPVRTGGQPRLPSRFVVSFHTLREFATQYRSRLRANALFVRTNQAAEPGTKVTIDLVMPNYYEALTFQACVRERVAPSPSREPGLEVALVDPPTQQMRFVHEFAEAVLTKPA